MDKKKQWQIFIDLTVLLLISFLPVFFIWLPFFFHLKDFFFLRLKEGGMENVLKNWDGPSYVLIAKAFYDIDLISSLKFVDTLPTTYFFAHFPLFPILIKLIGYFTGNLFYAGLILNLFFGYCLNLLFYYFIKAHTKHPFFLTFLFTVFPGRFLIVRSIIAPETLMTFLILLSLILFEKKRYFFSWLIGSLAVLVKIQSLFLFPAFFLSLFDKLRKKTERIRFSFLFIFLIPFSILGLFYFYFLKTGDFFIFLKAQKDNQLYFGHPFSQFNYQGAWAGTGWLEDIVFYFLCLSLVSVALYSVKQRSFFYFVVIYSLFLLFIPQRDVTRFTFPIWPIFYWRFANFFETRLFRLALFFILPAIYFYSINFILVNQAPIADWGKLIK